MEKQNSFDENVHENQLNLADSKKLKAYIFELSTYDMKNSTVCCTDKTQVSL